MISISEVSHRYGFRVALDGLSLELTGSRVGLLGPNGARKSTLIRLLTTLQAVQTGVVVVDGVPLGSTEGTRAVRERLGYVPQQMELPPGYTAEEFLAYASWMRGLAAPGPAIALSLERVGLSDRRSSKIKTLSGGMRQRLCIAQAVVHNPALLVVDEPSVGLDPQQRANLRSLLRGLDCRVVLATHLVDDIAGVADQVVILDHGRAIFSGTAQELCGDHAVTAEAVENAYLARVAPEAT